MSEDLLLHAQLGNADHIRHLVEGGVDPNWRREDGVTTLMIAALTGRLTIIEALIDAGATVDLRAPDGMTALLAATAYAHTTRDWSGIELLLSKGADPTLANSEGNDALMMAARHGLVEAVIALLKRGADPNRKNRYGTTSLMQAARGHLVETARVLLRAGADRTLTDERGLTASTYAREIGRPPEELAALLAPSGQGDVNSRQVSKFSHDDFRISLLGAWSENATSAGWEFIDVSGQRQIDVCVTLLDEPLDDDEREQDLAARMREHRASLRATSPSKWRFSEARLVQANDATQARFHGSCSDVFAAVCVYVAPTKTVALTYRDFRPNLEEEARGRQATESVASFRLK
ncbi:Ankyrin repeat protein [Labilithrix luteola]|uniref:Ankyrin repeat protein n=1 Tax=Labilithrix luteola TaxID=1391654 RepID=A0A0K1PX44_9BACT|nr:ankyrin repeat domain-containing protein [Labilithrix luteola]AKU98087.1 Ankyrin repeat protein [Labilithrix luteola]